MSRYKEAYIQETLAFINALTHDLPSPCSGEDGGCCVCVYVLYDFYACVCAVCCDGWCALH
jgi:hypothetical protein